MASENETLNIGSIRLKRTSLDPILHPDAARAARQRIAAIPDASALLQGSDVPATPTADLITDKQVLADQILRSKKRPVEAVSRYKIPSALSPMLTAIGIFAIVLLLFKAPIILSQLGYSLGSGKPAVTSNTPSTSEVIPADNTISIPKINVKAPVVYEPSIAEPAVQKALESGVVHYGNTAFPGQAGNVAIFGHSSNDWWEPGNFKFVFVLLDKLTVGDQITVDYQSKRYIYEVTNTKVVEPTDVAVLNTTTQPILTLITCSPPGTSLRRLVVTAKQISPAGSTAVAVGTPAASSSAVPSSSAPGFFTQLSQAWNGVVDGFKTLFGGSATGGTPTSSPGTTPDSLPAIK